MRFFRLLCLAALVAPWMGACTERSRVTPTSSTAAYAREAKRLGVPESIETPDGLHFDLIPAGSFRMGLPADVDKAHDSSEHDVALELPFYLLREPLTTSQCRRLAQRLNLEIDVRTFPGGVETLCTYGEAQRIASALSTSDAIWNVRLPSEAEWEYALTRHAGRNARLSPPATVGEWTHDAYAPHPDWRVTNPIGPSRGEAFVVKGEGAARGARRAAKPRERHALRFVMPIEYGLGAYGSVAVSFQLDRHVGDGRSVPLPVDLSAYRLRFVRMQERLRERSRGREPIWARKPVAGELTTLAMVPGRYYVYCETGEGTSHIRGLEVKFTVRSDASREQTLHVKVPLPALDMKRYGESRPQ